MNRSSLFAYRGSGSGRSSVALGVCAFVGFITVWSLLSWYEFVQQRFLPLPWHVVEALWRMLTERDFLDDIAISVGARLGGVPALGGDGGAHRHVDEQLPDRGCAARADHRLHSLPATIPALVPLLIIWFGIGEASKVAVLWMGTFFQLVLLIADDTKRVPREYIEIGYTLGAKPRQITRDIVLRAMLPSMVDNLRITLGWCWTWIIVAEIVAANSGIGHAIWSMRRFVKTPEVMAGILTVGVNRPRDRSGDSIPPPALLPVPVGDRVRWRFATIS